MPIVRTSAFLLLIAVAAAALAPIKASAKIVQVRPDPAARIAAQREAMQRFAALDGIWRGPAWTMLPSGERHTLTQTERVGSMLDGSVKVIEGRGYATDGSTGFNAFAVLSYDPDKQSFAMRSYAQGQVGDFAVRPTESGFAWEIPAGPLTIRYTAILEGDEWVEHGDRLLPGKEPVRFFEMTLSRVGDTGWPAAGEVGAE